MVRLASFALALLGTLSIAACGVNDGLGGGGGNGGGGGGGGGGNPDIDPECSQVEPINATGGPPADLLLVVDKSGSMADPLQTGDIKWVSMRSALQQIVGQYDGSINFGLSTFPTGPDCGPGSIVSDISASSGNSISAALSSIFPEGGTPTDSTIAAAQQYYASIPVNPEGRYVLLATDGEPNCGAVGDPLDPTVTESVAAIASLSQAGISTFVLGFGGNVNNFPTTLKQMAEAGGTSDYFAANNPDELATALAAIAAEVGVVSCTLRLSRIPDLPSELKVYIDGDIVDRDGNDGWTYDQGTNSITFHGAACDDLKGGGATQVEIDLACGEDSCVQECVNDSDCSGNDTCDFGCCVGGVQ